MSKIKIAICSVLKPVNDARMYEKFGISIAETGKYDVHIVGYPSSIPNHPYIKFYPLPPFNRISAGRFFAPWKIARILHKVKPEIIIVNTHELLLVALKFRILFGAEILYDIQENYFRNIWYQNNFPIGIKHILAVVTRVKEVLISPFLSYKILAEEKYREEIPFARKRAVTILNKYQPSTPIKTIKEKPESDQIRFFYSGTVSEVYGIKEAVKFYQSIKRIKSSTLTIIGHVTSNQIDEYINILAQNDPNISLNVSRRPVNHETIVAMYPFIDYALTPYHSNPSIDNCIPVKFYEYIAHKIPILVPDFNEHWKSFLSPFEAAIFLNFNSFSPEEVIHRMGKTTFYSKNNTSQVLWKSEQERLLTILASVANKKASHSSI